MALALCLLAGCTGSISGQDTLGTDPEAGGSSPFGQPGPGTMPGASTPPKTIPATPGQPGGPGNMGTPTAPLVLPSPTVRRLTVVQIGNALADLFGAAAPDVTADLEPDSDVSGYLSVGAARVAFSARATEKVEAMALRVARQVATAADRARIVGCTPTLAKDDPCVRSFLSTVGRRAWRRPLTPDELTRVAALGADAAASTANPWASIEWAVVALLQSPHFVYRAELGLPDPADATRRALGPWELASRLSFFLWNTIPDEALLASAASGKLSDLGELRAQTQRLLESPRARAAIATFVDEVFRLDAVLDLKQLPKSYPLLTSTIGPAMRSETLKLFDDVVFTKNGDLRDVLDARRTFVNRELAKLYALAAPTGTGFTEVALAEDGQRRGLLGHGAVLATTSHASTTSPTLRGKFVREVLLCQTIPPPPPDVSTEIPEDKAAGPKTMREKLSLHSQVPGCASCHLLTDPIGLAMESFDGLGSSRTTDAGKAIDTSGTLDGTPFADARGLASAVRNHANAGPCLVRHLFRYALGFIEEDGQTPALAELDQAFARDGFRLKALATALAGSVAFRAVGKLD